MSRHRGLSAGERAFVQRPPPASLARLATVTPAGDPHVVPCGWSWDAEAEVFVLGGHDVPGTARWRHVAQHPVAAITIDGVDTSQGWAPWALLVRGRAEQDPERGAILLHPDHVTSWELPEAG